MELPLDYEEVVIGSEAEDFDEKVLLGMENERNQEELFYEEAKVSWENASWEDRDSKAAKDAFGIKYLYPWQRIVISNILAAAEYFENPENEELQEDDRWCNGKQIVLLPTGAGKSLCFLTPALILKGPTLVLYPLLALMSDQKRRMDEGGLKSVIFKGGQSIQEREENFAKIKEGVSIILANPEVLQNEALVKRLAQCKIAHIAIDEAHCVAEWGDTFRPAYLNLGNVIKQLGVKVVTAFTATASPEVLKRVSEVLFDSKCNIVRSESDRPNIHYKVVNCYSKKRKAFSLALTEPKPLIIFCGTRSKSEDMARELSAVLGKDKVKFYHAGLSREEKDFVEKWFYPKTDAVLCCTCAFGMGVDKKDIHTVIHLEASPTAESYIQEAGRGGRDGSVATGILLWSRKDSVNASKFPEGSRQRVLKDFAEASVCRRQVLLNALGGEQAVCSGCDVCTTGGPAPFAEDAAYVLKYIKGSRILFSRNTLVHNLIFGLNGLHRKKNLTGKKINVWTRNDVEEILTQLEENGSVYFDNFLWKGRGCFGPKGKFHAKIDKSIRRIRFLRQHLLRRAQVFPLQQVRHFLKLSDKL